MSEHRPKTWLPGDRCWVPVDHPSGGVMLVPGRVGSTRRLGHPEDPPPEPLMLVAFADPRTGEPTARLFPAPMVLEPEENPR